MYYSFIITNFAFKLFKYTNNNKNMIIIKEKPPVKKRITQTLRKLIPNEECIVDEVKNRGSFDVAINRLKKNEGMDFTMSKVDGVLKVWRVV